MADIIKNCFLINAPAGSGKTTEIRAMVQRFIIENQKNNILCITYTNRAAEELKKDISSQNVFVGTIHAFLHSFMQPYFAHQDILELYFEIYGEKISERINNKTKKDNIAASNARYIEKYGQLDYETVRKNITTLSYNESKFSSLYYGGLSHDDLISFSSEVINRFPVIRKRISSKYQVIFIDEYQDTMTEVLRIFIEATINTKSKLYLFGDRMQQIYKNYDGTLENQFEAFDTTKALTTNYRSTRSIVEILNRIYNDASFIQNNSEKTNNVKADYPPKIIVSDDIQLTIEGLRKDNPDTLILYLFNKERFADIDALQLYEAFNSMKRYSYGNTYSAVEVLTTDYEDNPDPLLKILYCMVELEHLYGEKQFGKIIQTMKNNKAFFSRESWQIQVHQDKERVFKQLMSVFSLFDNNEITVSNLVDNLTNNHMVNEEYLNYVFYDEDYKKVLSVPLVEITRVYDYLKNPKVSTQHGVKGESHDSVIFVAEDGTKSLHVAMYRFFEMWGNMTISSSSLNQFYYDFTNELHKVEYLIEMKLSDLKKPAYQMHEKVIKEKINAIYEKFNENLYFQFIFGEMFELYMQKPNVTNARNCLKENHLYEIISAYKLFYVGCSRARRNLIVLLDSSKIIGDFELQKCRFEEIGFEVIKN